jgi:hypothetical protein
MFKKMKSSHEKLRCKLVSLHAGGFTHMKQQDIPVCIALYFRGRRFEFRRPGFPQKDTISGHPPFYLWAILRVKCSSSQVTPPLFSRPPSVLRNHPQHRSHFLVVEALLGLWLGLMMEAPQHCQERMVRKIIHAPCCPNLLSLRETANLISNGSRRSSTTCTNEMAMLHARPFLVKP